jgi:hypothetical protein
MNILLVDPVPDNKLIMLGLMKISTYHKEKGDNVDFVKGYSTLKQLDLFSNNDDILNLKPNYDKIYITSLFTYQLDHVQRAVNSLKKRFSTSLIQVGGICATLLPEQIAFNCGVPVHEGLLDYAEDCCPDYSLYPDLPYSITFASRGCIRKCHYCCVRKHEPEFFHKADWIRDIDTKKKYIQFWDNNWLASPSEDISYDIEQIAMFQDAGIKSVDFNQSLDCRLFDEPMAKRLSHINIKPIRFSFDNPSQEGHIQRAIELSKRYICKDIRVDVLYNFDRKYDTPEFFYYRVNTINSLGGVSYPMTYRPIDTPQKKFISPYWTERQLLGLKTLLQQYFSRGMIGVGREGMLEGLGCSDITFKRIIEEHYEKMRKSDEQIEDIGILIQDDMSI